MQPKQFLNLIVDRDYIAVEEALANGFDPNTPLNNDTPGVEWSSYTDDFRMMEIFWRAGAKATTKYIEDIFAAFESGQTPADLEEPEEDPLNYPDLTNDFSVEKLTFLKGELTYDAEDNSYGMYLPVAKFTLDDKVINTDIAFVSFELDNDLLSYIGKSVSFPVNPEEGYVDGSMLLRDAHNPVDIHQITFVNIEDNVITVELDAEFLFEYEDIGFKNERRKLLVDLLLSNR